MKIKHLLILASMAMALPSQALDQRTFYSSDKSKSFDATLSAYDAKKKVVTVENRNGKKKSFPLKVLSPECQKYVLANQDVLAISKNIRLSFEEVKEKRNGDAIPTSYKIEVRNNGKRSIKDVQLKYTLYYDQGNLTAGGTSTKTSTGTLTTGKMFDSDTITVETKKIDIVRTIKKAEGGG